METVCAVEYIRRMRGGSQPHLIRASDQRYYIIKVQNNPQGVRVLANEMFGTSLAKLLGLPAPEVAIIDVCGDFVRYSEDMVIQLEHGSQPCQAGLCCGSHFNEHSFTFSPDFFVSGGLENASDILGMLVFDKWTSNCDRRQLMFYRESPRELYRIMMIDQGDCFTRGKWTFNDDPIVGLGDCRKVYKRVSGLRDFEPWLYRLENQISLGILRELASKIPSEWHPNDSAALDGLVFELDQRRMLVRGLLKSTLRIKRNYFPRFPFEQAASYI
jgi:hypothetical protein